MVRAARADKFIELWTTDGKRIAPHVRLACSLASRCVGLLRFASMTKHDGLLLSPGGSVHTMGLRFPIDVVFLNRQMRILGLASNIPPWRFRRAPTGTKRTLELAAGQIAVAGLKLGSFVIVESSACEDDGPPTVVCRNLQVGAPRGGCERSPIQFSLRLPFAHRCESAPGCNERPPKCVGVSV
jgi:uncharacterized membrane protein (UPF0127 family)